MIQIPCSLFTDPEQKELTSGEQSFFPLTVNDGDIRQYITGYIPAHWHPELEIFLLRKGKVELQIEDHIYQLKEGEGCFINSGILHSFLPAAAEPCLFRSFVFDSGIVSGIPGSVFDTLYVRPLMENGPSFLKLEKCKENTLYFQQFAAAFHACENELPGYEFEVREALSKIVLFIKEKSRLSVSDKIPKRQEYRLKHMLSYIHVNIKKPITIRELSDSVHLCPRECQRIFKQYMHCRPMEYVQHQKIIAAAKQLQDTDLSITDIAFHYGFSNPGYFSRQFRECVGSTPTEYRKQIRKTKHSNQTILERDNGSSNP